ncbi:FAD-binding oxidoreductase [Aromatoleum toluolicum]|nr:FAD-binding oxidoreductase [Aromatoleum toluolicum]
MEDFSIEALRRVVGERGVITDEADLAPFCTDWRGMFKGRARCAVLPRCTAEVAAVVRLCAAAGVPIVPHGGNTGLSGGATPDASGEQVILSLSRMSAIRSLDVIGETMEVEAGCILQVAQEAAADAGLLLPITLAAEGSARIGGILSTNAGGTNVLRYGMARGRVLGLEVVTADGTIVSGLRQLRKDNAGYDWKQLFIGTEGTLGIVTAAVLQLAPKSRHRVTALLAVPSADDALAVLRLARQAIGETLNAFELMAGPALELVARHVGLTTPLAPAPWYVLLEASSSLPSLRDAVEEMLADVLERGAASDGVIAESEKQERELWHLRESITEAEARAGRSIKHDVSVPIALIPAFLRVADEAVMKAFPQARINAFGHAGDGNIHYNVIIPPDADSQVLNRLVHDLVVAHGGSISAEHGIGQYRVDELHRCRSAPELELARRIKLALDPAGLMNPGKVLPQTIVTR